MNDRGYTDGWQGHDCDTCNGYEFLLIRDRVGWGRDFEKPCPTCAHVEPNEPEWEAEHETERAEAEEVDR